jgi:hypothetical protein
MDHIIIKPGDFPGRRLLIFPIGGIITGVWAVLLIITIVYGIIDRLWFRSYFRGRKAKVIQEEGGYELALWSYNQVDSSIDIFE